MVAAWNPWEEQVSDRELGGWAAPIGSDIAPFRDIGTGGRLLVPGKNRTRALCVTEALGAQGKAVIRGAELPIFAIASASIGLNARIQARTLGLSWRGG